MQAFFEVLDVIAGHSRINYQQEGVHNLNITLNGTGFVANLIRASVEGFNVDEHIKVAMTNEPCLPRPAFLESWKLIRIYLLFLLNLYLIYNQVYIHRSKRFVCSFFHPLREKQRIGWLYDKFLNRRKKAFMMMAQRVKDKLKVHGAVKQNFLEVIYLENLHRLRYSRCLDEIKSRIILDRLWSLKWTLRILEIFKSYVILSGLRVHLQWSPWSNWITLWSELWTFLAMLRGKTPCIFQTLWLILTWIIEMNI